MGSRVVTVSDTCITSAVIGLRDFDAIGYWRSLFKVSRNLRKPSVLHLVQSCCLLHQHKADSLLRSVFIYPYLLGIIIGEN